MYLRKLLLEISAVLSILLLISCSDVNKLLQTINIQSPKTNLEEVKITSLTFSQADLEFDIRVDNPNPVGVSLNGFDYDLLINNNSFLKGSQNKKMSIAANGNTKIKLPLTLHYKDIYETYKSLINEDSVSYALKTGFKFNLPILGDVRVPLETKGHLPVLKIPVINLSSVKVKNIGFSSIDLQVNFEVDNPNAFSLALENFDYKFDVAGTNWIKGKQKKINLKKKQKSTVSIPVSLSILDMGSSILNMLKDGAELDYNLSGKTNIGSSIPVLKSYPLKFNKSGKFEVSK